MTLEVNSTLKDKLSEKKIKQLILMSDMLKSLSSKELVFKGGSSLLFAYGLDRFSEDLDFDSPYTITVKSIVNNLKNLKYKDINIKKDTATTKRLLVNFDDISIKIEISLRDSNIDFTQAKTFFNNLKVYSIDKIANLKLDAMENRTTARDLYDISFIVDTYSNDLSEMTKKRIINKFNYKEFMDLAIDYELAFKEDKILTESDLFKSVTRISEKIPEFKKNITIDKEPSIKLQNKKDLSI